MTAEYLDMDKIDRKIIELLSQDARRSLADIGAHVELSPSSVNERIRRLTLSGTIRRFTLEVDPAALEMETLVFVWVALREDADEDLFRAFCAHNQSVLECHHVTGGWSYLLKLRIKAMPQVEAFLAEMKTHKFLGRSETMIALSSPVADPLVLKDI